MIESFAAASVASADLFVSCYLLEKRWVRADSYRLFRSLGLASTDRFYSTSSSASLVDRRTGARRRTREKKKTKKKASTCSTVSARSSSQRTLPASQEPCCQSEKADVFWQLQNCRNQPVKTSEQMEGHAGACSSCSRRYLVDSFDQTFDTRNEGGNNKKNQKSINRSIDRIETNQDH